MSENTSERFVLGWPRSPSGWSSLQPDVDRLEKINPRKCLLIQFHPSTSHRVIFLVFRPVFPLTLFFFRKEINKDFSCTEFEFGLKVFFLKYFPGKKISER